MTIAPSSHAPSNHRKRSLEEVSVPTHHSNTHHHRHSDSQPMQKAPRSDFYLNRMDHRLKWALKCSREGNLRMMDFYLSQAKKDAIQSQSYGVTFVQWETWIRGQLQM